MKKSKQLLFSGIIDFAGTDPTKQLELKEAYIRYAKARRSKYEWIMSRIVVETQWIEFASKLSSYTESMPLPKPVPVTLLLQPSDSYKKFKVRISATEQALLKTHDVNGGELKTEILDARLTPDLLNAGNEDLIEKVMEFIVERMSVNRVLPGKVFLEYPVQTYERSVLLPFLKKIARQNLIIRKKGISNFSEFGYKITLASEQGKRLPDASELATLLVICRELHLEVKFSCPECKAMTTLDQDGAVAQFGIMNVYTAGLLAYAYDLRLEEITRILTETDPAAFTFSDRYLKWGEFMVPVSELKMMRSSVYGAFISNDLVQTLEEILRLKCTES